MLRLFAFHDTHVAARATGRATYPLNSSSTQPTNTGVKREKDNESVRERESQGTAESGDGRVRGREKQRTGGKLQDGKRESERESTRAGCRVKNLGEIAAKETEVQSGISPKGGKTLDEIKGMLPVPG